MNSKGRRDSLIQNETQSLTELRDRLQDLNLDDEYLETKNLVRFLRARNYNVTNAECMVRRNVEWMEEWKVKSLVTKYIPPEGWTEGFPISITGFNSEDGLVAVFPVGIWDPSLAIGMKDEYVRYTISLLEKVLTLMKKRAKCKDELMKCSVIVDCNGLGRKHYTHYDVLYGSLTAIKYFEANYPETVRVIYLVNYPYIFNLIWKLAKPLISPATHEKIQFLGSDKATWREAILKDADEDQFHETYGGTLPRHYKLPLDEMIESSESIISHNRNE